MKIFLLSISLLLAFALGKSNTSFEVSEVYNSSVHKVYAGYLNVSNNSEARIFYQLYAPANTSINNSLPLQVWFNGGPGCSSQLGNYGEFGPFEPYQDANGTTHFKYNNFNWALTRNVMFIDQPFGVGMSYTGNATTPNTTAKATDNIEYFFNQFFLVYPTLKSNPLYITGESYAGHYVPSFSARLIKAGYKLAGVAVGDGEVILQKQFELANMLLAGGVLSKYRFDRYRGYENEALQNSLQNKSEQASDIFNMETGELVNSEDITNITGIDYLNYRQYSGAIASSPFEIFLNSEIGRKTFQIPKDHTYVGCSIPIYKLFPWDIFQGFDEDFAFVVSNTRLLLYTGQNDVELNTAAGYKWISEMNWSGIEDFGKAPKKQFKPYSNDIVGFTKSYGNLSFAQINDAGHLVPNDQPQPAFAMMEKWMNSEF